MQPCIALLCLGNFKWNSVIKFLFAMPLLILESKVCYILRYVVPCIIFGGSWSNACGVIACMHSSCKVLKVSILILGLQLLTVLVRILKLHHIFIHLYMGSWQINSIIRIE